MITIKVGIVVTFGVREGLCWDEALRRLQGKMTILFLGFSDRYKGTDCIIIHLATYLVWFSVSMFNFTIKHFFTDELTAMVIFIFHLWVNY